MAMTADTTTGERARPVSRRRSDATEEALVMRASEETPAHLELLDDEYAVSIIENLGDGPKRARELVAACEGSRSTVYRRLDSLVEAGFVTAETTLDPDGHHCKAFRLVRQTVTVTVEDGGLTVSVRPR